MILLLLYAILYPIIDAYHDHLVVEGNKDWHLVKASMFCFNAMIITCAAFGGLVPEHTDVYKFIEYGLKLLFVFASCRWILFDMAFNLFSGNTLLYIGHTSWMDRNIPALLHLCLKVLFLVASVFLTIELFYV